MTVSVFYPGVCVSSAWLCVCVCLVGGCFSLFGLCVWHQCLGIADLGSVGYVRSSQWVLLAASCMGLCLSLCVCVCLCVLGLRGLLHHCRNRGGDRDRRVLQEVKGHVARARSVPQHVIWL